MVEVLKKIGWLPISKDEAGKPKQIWLAAIKKGQYGVFISIERHWVRELTSKGAVKETRFAGTSINFPIDPKRCEEMLNSVTKLVKQAIKEAVNFKTAESLEKELAAEYNVEEYLI